MVEMKIVLRAVLERCRPVAEGREAVRRRSITFTPGQGATAVLRERVETREPAASDEAALASV